MCEKGLFKFSYGVLFILYLLALAPPIFAQSCQENTVDLRWNDGKARINVRVVKTPKARKKGLMFVKTLSEYEGMLFVFEREEQRRFWMKNTFIALDIIYFDENGVFVSVQKGKPHDLTPLPSAAPAKYVLELNAGWLERHNINGPLEMRSLGVTQKDMNWKCQ